MTPAIFSDVGTTWKAKVIPQDLFGALRGQGKFHFAQTTIPGSWWTKTTPGTTYPPGELHYMKNGEIGLDTTYPYAPGEGDTTDNPFLGWPDNDSYQVSADSPTVPFLDPSGMRHSSKFSTYTMYFPGTNSLLSEIVPLHIFEWTFSAQYSDPNCQDIFLPSI